MNGAEYIAEFLAQRQMDQVFLLTGGAATFMVDALGRHPTVDYKCFQHEQCSAMAADAVWRVNGKTGAVMATSGPGATNLVTGIACNWFDSIPALYITGQVNLRDAEVFKGSKVRQIGFQETDIVSLVKPITKYARQVLTVEDLKEALQEGYNAAISPRMGPSLIDVPMDIQKAEAGDVIEYTPPVREKASKQDLEALSASVKKLLDGAERPVVMFGAGVGLAGVEKEVEAWLAKTGLPFVATWNAAGFFSHALPNYLGCIGVYGNRGANYVLQNCDALLVLGSRLDTRVRPGNGVNFVPGAKVHVVDIDIEEIKKYKDSAYTSTLMDMRDAAPVVTAVDGVSWSPAWTDYVKEIKEQFYRVDISTSAKEFGTISPYAAIGRINDVVDDDGIVIVDCGATTCWFYQFFHRTNQTIFTNGGCAPISYGLAACIGAKFVAPEKQVTMIIGDGGFQSNLQEMQTIAHYGLDVKIVILNNYGYGIVKQFQDLYMGGRHDATGRGYSLPDIRKVVESYGLEYARVDTLEDFTPDLLKAPGARVIDVTLHENTLIEPKTEFGRPINDQYPFVSDEDFKRFNRFVPFERKNISGSESC